MKQLIKVIVLCIIFTLISTVNATCTKISAEKQDNAKKVIETAKGYMGVPYKFGGVDLKGFDCSGFVYYVFNKNGINLPRTVDLQYTKGNPIVKQSLQQGDLVFFTTYEKGASHCGIYLEKGNFIHASSSKGVMISNLNDIYWKPRYIGARRVL